MVYSKSKTEKSFDLQARAAKPSAGHFSMHLTKKVISRSASLSNFLHFSPELLGFDVIYLICRKFHLSYVQTILSVDFRHL